MQTEKYRGYTLWGHAILQQEDILQPSQFAGSGTVTRDRHQGRGSIWSARLVRYG